MEKEGYAWIDGKYQPIELQIKARQLRFATITNVWKQGLLTDDEAKELLSGALTPGDDSTIVDDSGLLGDPDGLEKVKEDT